MKSEILSRESIESRALDFLKSHFHSLDFMFYEPVDPEQLIQNMGLELYLDDLTEHVGDNVLGAWDYPSNIIWIDERLDPTENKFILGRYRFTLAHEIGHVVLHKELLEQSQENLNQLSLLVVEKPKAPTMLCMNPESSYKQLQRDKTDQEWIEWQADQFAACLLMPATVIREMVAEWVNNSSSPLASGFDWHFFKERLASRLQVSKQSLEIRLKHLRLQDEQGYRIKASSIL